MAKPTQTIDRTPSGGNGEGNHVNLFSRTGRFFVETVHELRRVQWPGRREVFNYTVASLLVCFIMGALVWAFDIGVAKIMALLGVGV